MTEDEARSWIVDRYGTEATDRLSQFAERVVAENAVQNLISPATAPTIWSRHLLDSAQLLSLVPTNWKVWLDIGTGGGFPGLVIALLAPDRAIIMSEPRTRRAAFLQTCVAEFGLSNARVEHAKVENITCFADVISARAVAPVRKVLLGASHCATDCTTWLLPRGRSGMSENEASLSMFHVKHSITDPASVILVGRGRLR